MRLLDVSACVEQPATNDWESEGIARCAAERVAITVDAQGAPLSEVIFRLAEVAPVRVGLDWQLDQETRETPVSAFAFEGPLDQGIGLLASAHGLVAVYDAAQVVITSPAYARLDSIECWYDTRGVELPEFIPPTIQLVGPDTVSDDCAWGGEALEPVQPYSNADLPELVRSAVEPTYWTIHGFSVELLGDRLFVRCSPRLQEKVAEFLAALPRSSFSGSSAANPYGIPWELFPEPSASGFVEPEWPER